MYNRVILVAGAGTSGTSLLAGVLKALGCHVPQPEVGAGGEPQGFGDPQWVVNFHTKLLREASVRTVDARPAAWALTAAAGREPPVGRKLEGWLRDQVRKGDHVVVKDPRLLWFIPTWRRAAEAVATPCFVTVHRHPLDVIASRETGYGEHWHPNALTAGWVNTMLYSERATRGDRRALVRHEDLTADAMQTVSKMSEELDLEVVERPSAQEMRVATALVEPAKPRARPAWSDLEVDLRLVELAEDVAGTLDRAAAAGTIDTIDVKADLDRLRKRYLELYTFVETAAQFSIETAGGRSPAAIRSPQPDTPSAMMRDLMRRGKRKTKRTLRELRAKRAASGSGAAPPAPRQGA